MLQFEKLPKSLARYLSYQLSIRNRSEKTVYEYSVDLNNFLLFTFKKRRGIPLEEELDITLLDDGDMASVSTQEIYNYLLYAATILRNGTAARARKLCAIRGFFKFLFSKEKSIPDNPAKDIDSPSVKKSLPKFLSEGESENLLQAAQNSDSPAAKRDYAIMTLFLNCGMRVSELCGISLHDINDDYSQLVVTGKGNKERMIYLNQSCRDALAAYLVQRRSLPCTDGDALFVSRNHHRISVKTVQWLVYKYLRLAGLSGKEYSVHKLRHTAATLMYNTGKVDVRVLKEILGHEQLNTTQIYTHVSDQLIKQAMDNNPLNQGHRSKNDEN